MESPLLKRHEKDQFIPRAGLGAPYGSGFVNQ